MPSIFNEFKFIQFLLYFFLPLLNRKDSALKSFLLSELFALHMKAGSSEADAIQKSKF